MSGAETDDYRKNEYNGPIYIQILNYRLGLPGTYIIEALTPEGESLI